VKKVFRVLGLGALAALVAVGGLYALDMTRAYERVRGKGTVVHAPQGDVEYTARGSGPVVLVIHGSGGGWDQGELVAAAALGEGGFRVITPSRFGYLGSTFSEGATFDDQAHAYAALLDALGVDKVAVVALSHGGPSALLFAALHPERVSSLTLISCGVASSTAAEQAQAGKKGDMLATIFKYDPLYWAIARFFKGQLVGLMGADAATLAAMTPEQRATVDRLIDEMNPVSIRSNGAGFDNQAAMPNARVAAIKAPTLIFHARDDGLQLFRNAEFAAANIPGARLVTFERGGHLILATEQAAIREAVRAHVLANVSP
jgi:2-hydroxy-6-oxonona-2,4-dienedioate hydrolase